MVKPQKLRLGVNIGLLNHTPSLWLPSDHAPVMKTCALLSSRFGLFTWFMHDSTVGKGFALPILYHHASSISFVQSYLKLKPTGALISRIVSCGILAVVPMM